MMHRAGDVSSSVTPGTRSRRAPQRFTVDAYDGRAHEIRKYHRSETLTSSVDTLSLRSRTVLTPSPDEVRTCPNEVCVNALMRCASTLMRCACALMRRAWALMRGACAQVVEVVYTCYLSGVYDPCCRCITMLHRCTFTWHNLVWYNLKYLYCICYHMPGCAGRL